MTSLSRRSLLAVLAVVGVLVAGLPQRAGAADSPVPLVEDFHATLLSVMQDAKSLGMQGRYDRIVPALETTFAVRTMVAITTVTAWKGASDAEKDAVAAAFKRVSAATYASHFKEYSGQTFDTLGTKDGPRGTTIVETNLNDAGRGAVSIVYVTKKSKGKWKVIDVIVDKGISELALRKSEYRQILRDKGMSGLVATLNEKADDLLEEGFGDEGDVGGYGN